MLPVWGLIFGGAYTWRGILRNFTVFPEVHNFLIF